MCPCNESVSYRDVMGELTQSLQVWGECLRSRNSPQTHTHTYPWQWSDRWQLVFGELKSGEPHVILSIHSTDRCKTQSLWNYSGENYSLYKTALRLFLGCKACLHQIQCGWNYTLNICKQNVLLCFALRFSRVNHKNTWQNVFQLSDGKKISLSASVILFYFMTSIILLTNLISICISL